MQSRQVYPPSLRDEMALELPSNETMVQRRQCLKKFCSKTSIIDEPIVLLDDDDFFDPPVLQIDVVVQIKLNSFFDLKN